MSGGEFLVAVLDGDGIGPEVNRAAVEIAGACAERFDLGITFEPGRIGGHAMDVDGVPLPDATVDLCRRADAVLLGAVGGPKWDDPKAPMRPEQGLLAIRKELGLFANIRPVRVRAGVGSSPLRSEIASRADLVFVRELTGGLYFGEKRRDVASASDVCSYTATEIERVVRVAAEIALSRAGGTRARLTSVDKANVLETSRLWREVATRVVETEFSNVQLQHVLVDSMAMHLITRPMDFDVIVAENMFGDILTDEASVLAGSLGLLPSASLAGDQGLAKGLYEPIHGSAPDLVGTGSANPVAAVLSVALMFRLSLGAPSAADAIERAVDGTLEAGIHTPDLGGTAKTEDVVTAILDRLS